MRLRNLGKWGKAKNPHGLFLMFLNRMNVSLVNRNFLINPMQNRISNPWRACHSTRAAGQHEPQLGSLKQDI